MVTEEHRMDKQLNIKLNTETLLEIERAMRNFGGDGYENSSEFGRLALKYFIKALKEKGVIKILSEVMD